MAEEITENKIRKVIFNEVTIVATVVIFFSSLILTYADLKMQIALLQADVNTIKTNELVHLKGSIESIESRNSAADARQSNMENQITKILTLLGKD
jgi:CRISPR/Cas system-associated protein Csx1